MPPDTCPLRCLQCRASNRETLEIRYKGSSIHEVLDMTVGGCAAPLLSERAHGWAQRGNADGRCRPAWRSWRQTRPPPGGEVQRGKAGTRARARHGPHVHNLYGVFGNGGYIIGKAAFERYAEGWMDVSSETY